MNRYDIFISYRREGGFELSQAIYHRLVNDGYAAFLDLEQLKSGQFNTALLSVIDQCQDFLLILPPKALDRCCQEDDWVRQEVEHALKQGKNIIPVMLRGFEWPDKETLPESLRDLSMYNGISATDHNLFNENIERLKKTFLLSRPGFTWRRYKYFLIPLLVCMLCCAGYLFSRYVANNRTYEQMCNRYTVKLMAEVAQMHHNYELCENGYQAWEDFVNDRGVVYAESGNRFFVQALECVKKSLKKPTEFVVSETDARLFERHGVDIADLEILPMVFQSYYEEVLDFFDNLELLSGQSISPYLVNQAALNRDFQKLSLENNYYGLLGLLSTMPDSVEEKIREVAPTLSFLSTIPVGLEYADYEMMVKGTTDKMEGVVAKMNRGVNSLQMDAEALEYKKERMEEELSKAYTDARLQNIENKRVAVEKRRAELAEADQKLTELYQQAREKFALQPSDDQPTMWGKILRMVRLAESALKAETEERERHEALVEAAKTKGLDWDYLLPPMHTITAQEKFQDVDKWLVKYEAFNPAQEVQIGQYVAAVRAYYKAVVAGKQNPQIGVVVVATQDNLPHPQFKVGDIVIERKGKVIRTVQDYIDMANDPAENRLRVLRLENGLFSTYVFTVAPDCPVLIGLSELHES